MNKIVFIFYSLHILILSCTMVAGNKQLKVVVDFRLALRHAQHAAIFECFRKFNQKGGAVVPLQTGKTVYFGRACILAIYADQPAAKNAPSRGLHVQCVTPRKTHGKSGARAAPHGPS